MQLAQLSSLAGEANSTTMAKGISVVVASGSGTSTPILDDGALTMRVRAAPDLRAQQIDIDRSPSPLRPENVGGGGPSERGASPLEGQGKRSRHEPRSGAELGDRRQNDPAARGHGAV